MAKAKNEERFDDDEEGTGSVAVKDEPRVIIAPFAIEADHPRNDDLLVQAIPGCRLRSAIDGSKAALDRKTGESLVPLAQAQHLSSFPKTPGMQLHVDPANLSYSIVDPLATDDTMCEKVQRWMRQNHATRGDGKIKGVPTQNGKLDVHRMKTLCREMFNLVQEGAAKKCKGPMPSMADIDELPGHFLLNPGSRVPNLQPNFEKDYDAWLEKLTASGG